MIDLDDAVQRMPPQPKTVRDTGLELSLLVELVAKTMYAAGKVHLPVLTGKLRLSVNVLREVLGFMLAEKLVEVAARGDSDLDVHYQLTSAGKVHGADALARSRYAGPAPVTLQAYREMVQRQRAGQGGHAGQPTQAEVAAAFAEDSLEPQVRNLIGAALQSSRSLLLHGPSGSGKTTLARKLGQLQRGAVAVPYAVLVERAIVQIHDPLVHLAAPGQPGQQGGRAADDWRMVDSRWTLCQRPLIQVGAELGPEMLDLRYDAASGTHHAPPHCMANNGMLLVDDLGRQKIETADLLNRWSGPLDTGIDQLTLDGHKVGMPFDLTLVLATNLSPHVLLDDAAMRRVGYKIHVGALGEAGYRSLFRRQCRLARIACDDAVLDYLVMRLHGASARPLLACMPRELLGRIADFAGYAGTEARLSNASLDQAWASMFASCTSGAPAPAQPPVPFFAESGDPLVEKIA